MPPHAKHLLFHQFTAALNIFSGTGNVARVATLIMQGVRCATSTSASGRVQKVRPWSAPSEALSRATLPRRPPGSRSSRRCRSRRRTRPLQKGPASAIPTLPLLILTTVLAFNRPIEISSNNSSSNTSSCSSRPPLDECSSLQKQSPLHDKFLPPQGTVAVTHGHLTSPATPLEVRGTSTISRGRLLSLPRLKTKWRTTRWRRTRRPMMMLQILRISTQIPWRCVSDTSSWLECWSAGRSGSPMKEFASQRDCCSASETGCAANGGGLYSTRDRISPNQSFLYLSANRSNRGPKE